MLKITNREKFGAFFTGKTEGTVLYYIHRITVYLVDRHWVRQREYAVKSNQRRDTYEEMDRIIADRYDDAVLPGRLRRR